MSENWMVRLKAQEDFEHNAVISSSKIAIAEDMTNSDILNIKFILCHEGANLNQDGFFDDELKASYKSIVHKPINWGHSRENIGVVVESHYLDPMDIENYLKAIASLGVENLVAGETKKFVLCEAVIWKLKHPERAQEMVEAHSKGKLFFSMENFFDEVECSVCKANFSGFPYCEHLAFRRKTGQAVRYFRNFIFTGAGKVDKPGDPGARGLSFAASDDTTEFINILNDNDLFLNSKSREQFNYYVDHNHYIKEDCPCESQADFPSDEDESWKITWLFICKQKNPELFNEMIAELRGEDMKTYTQEELQTAVAEEIEKFKKANESTKVVDSLKENEKVLNESIANLTKQNETLVSEKESLSKQLEESKAKLQDIEDNAKKDQEFASRIKILEDEKIPFTADKIKDLIWGKDEKSFASLKDVLAIAVKMSEDEKKKEEEKKKAEDKKKKGSDYAKASEVENEKIENENESEADLNEDPMDEIRSLFKGAMTNAFVK